MDDDSILAEAGTTKAVRERGGGWLRLGRAFVAPIAGPVSVKLASAMTRGEQGLVNAGVEPATARRVREGVSYIGSFIVGLIGMPVAAATLSSAQTHAPTEALVRVHEARIVAPDE